MGTAHSEFHTLFVLSVIQISGGLPSLSDMESIRDAYLTQARSMGQVSVSHSPVCIASQVFTLPSLGKDILKNQVSSGPGEQCLRDLHELGWSQDIPGEFQ